MLMMIVDHSPSQLRVFTDQPIGFFTTAEGFVFVSAFLAGMLFRRRMEESGFAAARSATVGRAWRIYRAHLLTVSFAFVIGSFFLSEFSGVGNLLDQYLRNPAAALVGSALLLFRPPLMDILPMYIWFSFLTPLAFLAAQRWGWKIPWSALSRRRSGYSYTQFSSARLAGAGHWISRLALGIDLPGRGFK